MSNMARNDLSYFGISVVEQKNGETQVLKPRHWKWGCSEKERCPFYHHSVVVLFYFVGRSRCRAYQQRPTPSIFVANGFSRKTGICFIGWQGNFTPGRGHGRAPL